MLVVNAIRQRARVVIGPILGISLVAYFAYHLVQGDRGLLAWMRLSQEIRKAQTTLAQVEAEEAPLAHHALLMRAKIDRDLLDEEARETLNLNGPGEIVIFNRPAQH
ncbi:MAG TPA: septum formation initiator family protein [Stellaceae bacterium]|nr:septum formation initiator family protein [Stellaceae bacterium]